MVAKSNHPSGDAPIGTSRMLLGGRPTRTLGAVGNDMKVHMVHAYELREWTNQHGAMFTDWSASCGASGTKGGHYSRGLCSSLTSLDFAVRAMLCPKCCPRV
jgi:hypothetical protein